MDCPADEMSFRKKTKKNVFVASYYYVYENNYVYEVAWLYILLMDGQQWIY